MRHPASRVLILMVTMSFAAACDGAEGAWPADGGPGDSRAGDAVTDARQPPADVPPDAPPAEDTGPADLPVPPDGVPDAGEDLDAGADLDAGEDLDVGADLDAGEDLGTDAGLDAGADPDAGTDLGDVGDPCGADGGPCKPELACCYPCGIPDCTWVCAVPCDPTEPWCAGGCPMLP